MSSIGLLVGGAICILLSWAHVILSAEILPAGAFSSTLFGYALAVIFACLVSGWATDSLRGGLIRLLVIALWVGVLIGGVQAGAFLVLEQNGSSSLLGVALGTALCFALSFKHPRRTLAIFLCTSMAAGLALESIGSMTATTVLGANLVVALCLLLFRLGNEPSDTSRSGSFTGSGTTSFRTMDVLLAGAILNSDQATQYLTAWCFAMSCCWMIGVLESALGPRLLEAYHYGDKGALAALAARTNLGFLLIGGGGITFIFLTVQAVLDLTHSHATLILPIVAWILLSHCGPVILGASGLLMEVTRMQRQRSWVLGLWTPIALGSILLVKPDTPIELAKHVALLHLGYSAHLAVVLGMRHGVWPGITALLQKELKLT